MTTIHTPVLTSVEHDHSTRTATVKVEYMLHLADVESSPEGQRYRESIELWASDNPCADDYLYTFSSVFHSNTADPHIPRVRAITIAEGLLGENGVPKSTDEIFTKVCITPLPPVTVRRNENHQAAENRSH